MKYGSSQQGNNTWRVCENRALRKISEPKREEVTEDR
jgi:hypothetical protein